MMKRMRSYLLLIPLIFSLHVRAQEDSLQRLIRNEKDPARKIDLLFQLADLTKNSDPSLSFTSTNDMLQLLKKRPDAKKQMEGEYLLALYYNKTEKIDSLLYYTRKNIPLLRTSEGHGTLLVNYINLEGAYYMHLGRQRDALERYYDGLKIADESGDPVGRIRSMGNIGWAYMELNQFDTAIVNFKKTALLMQSSGLNKFAAVYNNIASCYGDLKQYDSARRYVLTGIEVARNNKDLVAEANGLNILGTVLQATQNYPEALKVLLQAKAIREKLGDPFFVVSDMATIAELYTKTGDAHKGIVTGREALRIALENNITAKYPMIYQTLANSYEAAQDYAAASKMYRKLSELKDSIYADASPQALAEMQTKYETEKKERQIAEQNSKIARQKILIAGAVLLGVLGVLLIFTQYRRYQWKQEARLRNEILKQQEMAMKAVLEAEEAERQRIAKDLHDGVGQMMSAAKMNLSAFEHEKGFRTPEEKLAFERIISLVDDSCREVRTVSHNMMPNALLKNSLAAAVKEFINKLDQKKLRVHLYTESLDEKLDSNLETVLYRVIQECVNNVIKHAGASTLDISLIREPDGIRASIEDNGRGFDTTDRERFEGIGLKNIRTRIEYLKGTVDFDSAPGRGTLVALHVPL